MHLVGRSRNEIAFMMQRQKLALMFTQLATRTLLYTHSHDSSQTTTQIPTTKCLPGHMSHSWPTPDLHPNVEISMTMNTGTVNHSIRTTLVPWYLWQPCLQFYKLCSTTAKLFRNQAVKWLPAPMCSSWAAPSSICSSIAWVRTSRRRSGVWPHTSLGNVYSSCHCHPLKDNLEVWCRYF